ncbi:hypothetical protein [Absidia glauca]|uniref:Uncharacterized protein n=1 Tax=Absidia glauca TaxID=4829 RepID=A0A168MU88_ABSGL|nr:hypothetical protein [Absidia glauca]
MRASSCRPLERTIGHYKKKNLSKSKPGISLHFRKVYKGPKSISLLLFSFSLVISIIPSSITSFPFFLPFFFFNKLLYFPRYHVCCWSSSRLVSDHYLSLFWCTLGCGVSPALSAVRVGDVDHSIWEYINEDGYDQSLEHDTHLRSELYSNMVKASTAPVYTPPPSVIFTGSTSRECPGGIDRMKLERAYGRNEGNERNSNETNENNNETNEKTKTKTKRERKQTKDQKDNEDTDPGERGTRAEMEGPRTDGKVRTYSSTGRRTRTPAFGGRGG